MTHHITTTTTEGAWKLVNEIIPSDYEYNTIASRNAGYDVYTTTYGNHWVSDLGIRLEVNLESGETYEIWIDEPKEEVSECEILNLAYASQLKLWTVEKDYAEHNPSDPFSKARAERAWVKLEAIRRKLLAAERKQKTYER